MHKPDLEARIAGLSRDELANIVRDLAADSAIKERVVTAVDLSQSHISDRQPSSFFDRISKSLRGKPKPEALARTSTTSSETIIPNPEASKKTSIASSVTVTPTPKASSKTSTPTSEKNTRKSKTVISDIQVCDNCHKLFRLSMAETLTLCNGHPGKLKKLRDLFPDGQRLEQVKRQCATGTAQTPDPCWTCCLKSKYNSGCRNLYHHVCSRPVLKGD